MKRIDRGGRSRFPTWTCARTRTLSEQKVIVAGWAAVDPGRIDDLDSWRSQMVPGERGARKRRASRPADALDDALQAITAPHGERTRNVVAMQLEYQQRAATG